MTVKKLLSNALSMSQPKSQSLVPLLQAQNTSFGSIVFFAGYAIDQFRLLKNGLGLTKVISLI